MAFLLVILFAMCFASLSMILASLLKTRDRMMGIGQAITTLLFFASNAIYPISIMPRWLQIVSVANPLSYVVDAMRALLLTGIYTGLGDRSRCTWHLHIRNGINCVNLIKALDRVKREGQKAKPKPATKLSARFNSARNLTPSSVRE